jgi:hypothetical protein
MEGIIVLVGGPKSENPNYLNNHAQYNKAKNSSNWEITLLKLQGGLAE